MQISNLNSTNFNGVYIIRECKMAPLTYCQKEVVDGLSFFSGILDQSWMDELEARGIDLYTYMHKNGNITLKLEETQSGYEDSFVSQRKVVKAPDGQEMKTTINLQKKSLSEYDLMMKVLNFLKQCKESFDKKKCLRK